MSGLQYDYSTRRLNGGVVRLSGQFYNWFGTITVRPAEVAGGEPTLSYSGNGKLTKHVEVLALAAFLAAQS